MNIFLEAGTKPSYIPTKAWSRFWRKKKLVLISLIPATLPANMFIGVGKNKNKKY